MAIVNGSALGFFRGKLGNAVSYQLYGKNVVRSLPEKSAKNKKGSVEQNVFRSRFTQVQEMLRPMLSFIRAGFNMEGRFRQMSAHNAAKSHNLKHAFGPDGKIDYSQFVVSYGNLAGPEGVSLAQDDAGLHFSWRDNSVEHADRFDQVMLLVYFPDKGETEMILSGARRTAGSETLAIGPIEKDREFHAWISFISDDRQQIATSVYVTPI